MAQYSKDQLRSIFQNRFNQEAWKSIVVNIFGAGQVRRVYEKFTSDEDLEEGYFLGSIDTLDSYRIGLFYYKINSGSVVHKKVGFRNLLKKWVNPNWGEFEAAIVVFDDGEEWRLSFICDIKEEATAPKRFTYIFGEKDNFYKTPVDRFEKLQTEEPTFVNIRKTFSVDALSDDFFDDYRELYADFVQYITGKRYVKSGSKWEEKVITRPNHQFQTTFEGNDKLVRDYIKKMFGRIVFLYFLQRKGWLNNNKQYMHDLFYDSDKKNDFLDGVLEPLFFEVLNEEKSNRTKDAKSLPGCDNIPYLNGGLFARDEIDERTCVFPADYFKRLFDFLDSYNFTIDENDTDDAEIGIDPEMLGRIFENLLEDNKDKGAFYTPREIVDYMCRESLIAYLIGGLPEIRDEKIRLLVEKLDTTDLSDKDKLEIRKTLQKVKICDPAIGSGAFPMGLVNLLSKIYVAMKSDTDTTKMKRHIMEQNIYGVDIEKGAVDIARLRFWLSMIVEEKEPIPLPNLHFKIMQGNSLLESYNGIDLSDLTNFEIKVDKKGQIEMDFGNNNDRMELDLLLKRYYNTSNHTERDLIFKSIIKNVNLQLKEKNVILPIGEDPSANPNFFLWHTWFSYVFAIGGFDIIIGNPPYVEVINSNLYESYYTFNCFELYAHFFELGIKLLKQNGTLAFITGSLYIKGMKFEPLRQLLRKNASLLHFRNEGDNVFDEVGMPTSTIILSSEKRDCSWPFDGNDLIVRLSNTFDKLGDLCEVQRGLEIGKKSLTTNGSIKILTGGDVGKFVAKSSSTISIETLNNDAKDPYFYEGERFTIRETGSELNITYLEEPIYVNRTLYTFKRKKDSPSIRFIVGCLSSELLQYFYTEKFKAPTDLFPKIRIGQAKQLPICHPSNWQEEKISSLVSEIINKAKEGLDYVQLIHTLNLYIYKIYSLTYEEILIVNPETLITREEYESFNFEKY